MTYNISYEDDALSSSNISSGLDGISKLKKGKPAYYKDVYYFEKVNAKSEIDSSCDELTCVVNCSCKSGWNDTVGTRTAQKEFITLTSKINRRLSCTKAVGCDDFGYSYTSCPDGYNCGTAQKPYGTLVCYAQQTAKTCADYGYLSSCPSGQSGTAHSVKLGSTTSTCYSDCKASYFDLTLKGGTCSSSSNSCPFDLYDGTVTSATGTNHESTHNNISAGKQLTITKVGKIGISSITVAYNNSSSTHTLPYTFTMPAYDVRISATPNTNDCMTCETGGTGSGDDDDTKCGTIYFTTAAAGINSSNMTASLRNKLKNTKYKVMAFCIATTAQPTLTMSGYVKHMAGTQNVSGDITCYQDGVGEYVDWGVATGPNLKGSEITELYYTDTNGQKVDLLTASGKVYYNGTCLKVGTISKSF